MQPKTIPRTRRSRGVERGYMRFRSQLATMSKMTMTAVEIIHTRKCLRTRSANNWSRLCEGSEMAPNSAMRSAPIATSSVPMKEYLVKGSLSMMEAHIELKTRPEACRVERTGSGRVVIWMVLPTMFATMNMSMPSYGKSANSSCVP